MSDHQDHKRSHRGKCRYRGQDRGLDGSVKILPAIRGRDAHGAGYYGASRNGRTHNGIDIVAGIGTTVRAYVPGVVSKLGYPYADKLRFRYVEITDARGFRTRYFYVEPRVKLKDAIAEGQAIGTVQALPYEGITPHIHFEVMVPGTDRQFVDPIKYLCGDATWPEKSD